MEPDLFLRISEIFPGISHEYVKENFADTFQVGTDVNMWCNFFIDSTLGLESYPKEQNTGQGLKRKRRESVQDEIEEWKNPDREAITVSYTRLAIIYLQNEFPNVPKKFIQNTLKTHTFLIHAYLAIETAERQYDPAKDPPYRRKAQQRTIDFDITNPVVVDLRRELEAAKKRSTQEAAQRKLVEENAAQEAENLRHALQNNAIAECLRSLGSTCCSDYPLNRMASCDAPNPHYSCIVCVNKYIETEIGMNQCRTNCIDSSGCMGVFSSVQLRACLHERNFEKLEKLQQENDIRLAGLEGLEECPFCDFKAICPPAEIDREFRCQDSCCQKISCRLCQAESHVPQTCEEFARGHKKFDVRRQIEEAMSTALIRHCNKCGTAFLKEGGCNKMMCTMCKAYQCYVCSKSVKGQNYDHFHRGPCPLYDNYVRRDDETVKNAEAKASAKVRAENPYLTADDLKIGVSDAVQEEERVRLESADEAERIRLAGEQRNLFLEAPGPIHRPMWTRPAEGDYGVLHDNIQLIAEQVNNRAGALPPPDPRLEGIRWREHLQGPER